ncbi:MAG: FG-GAP repeat domain-containing protein [Chitinophagaceae bacterium]
MKYQFVTISVISIILFACGGYKKNSTHQEVSNESIRKGEQIAHQYCQSCHVFPDPSLLDSKTWENGVLPGMGPMLGIYHMGFQNYPSFRSDTTLKKGFYPDKQILTVEEWQSVIDYYTSLSPDSLSASENDEPIEIGLKQFVPKELINTSNNPPLVSLVKFDTTNSNRSIIFYDVNRKSLFRYDASLYPIDSIAVGKSIVDVVFEGSDMAMIDMGIMRPNNGSYGFASKVQLGKDIKMRADSLTLINNLKRPVQILLCDFNGDGIGDYLICEYGNMIGSLSWYEGKEKGEYVKHTILEMPGSIKVIIKDLNEDQKQDIIALFAQGDESIYTFMNKGDGSFQANRIMRFPSVYGSTSFDIADLNKDGLYDIIYTCGDNADYSTILKPYHGVYVFINEGKDHFNQKYFFHLNGCFKVIAEDFDHDGDVDLSTISHFADFKKRSEESFVYLENLGNLSFKAYGLPESYRARWLTMDAGDMDHDGKKEIILGNFMRQNFISTENSQKKMPVILLLKNISK